jgi:hypothetical protein
MPDILKLPGLHQRLSESRSEPGTVKMLLINIPDP